MSYHRPRFNLLAAQLFLGLLLTAAGCIRETLPADEVDLVRLFPLAQTRVEVADFDPGDPNGRTAFTSGWSGKGATWWGVGEQSVLTFFVGQPRNAALVFRCQPLRFPGAPPQEMVVSLNGQEIGRTILAPAPRDYRLEIPRHALGPGQNFLVFAYSYSRKPEDVVPGSRDRRELAVAWRYLRLLGLGASGTPYAINLPGKPTLTLPLGTEVTYYIRVRPGAALVVDGLIPLGRSAGDGPLPTLEASIRFVGEDAEAGGNVHHLELELPETPGRVLLDGSRDDVAEISLRAVVNGGEGASAGLRIVGPRLELPAKRTQESQDAAPATRAFQERPNVIVYLIDTLRADHLGAYGYPRQVSPRIDELAAGGTVFRRAVAPTSWTRPSIASLFTGLYPQSHGVNGSQDGLPDGPTTLAELLSGFGYRTVGFTTNGNVHPKFGLGRGFDRYELVSGTGGKDERYRSSRTINRVVERWLAERDDSPFFLFLHTVDPHSPYVAEAPWAQRFAADVADPSVGAVSTLQALNRNERPISETLTQDLTDLYDAEIAANDHYFGELIDVLKREALYEGSMIILLSDHGEEFGDHGRWSHGLTLFEEQLHVPLIVKWPNAWQRGTEERRRVELIDIAPTILSSVGAEAPPESFQGTSLLPLLLDSTEPTNHLTREPAFAYLDKDRRKIEAVAAGRYKLIRYHSYDRPRGPYEVYDLDRDEAEQVNRADELAIPMGYLDSLLRATALFWPRPDDRSEVEIDDELRSRLEALGYLQ